MECVFTCAPLAKDKPFLRIKTKNPGARTRGFLYSSWRKCMGIEPTWDSPHCPTPDLKSGSPTSELGTSGPIYNKNCPFCRLLLAWSMGRREYGLRIEEKPKGRINSLVICLRRHYVIYSRSLRSAQSHKWVPGLASLSFVVIGVARHLVELLFHPCSSMIVHGFPLRLK